MVPRGMIALGENDLDGPGGMTVTRGEHAATAQARGTRDLVVAAAIELFARGGYDGTSVKASAEKVGISDAGVL